MNNNNSISQITDNQTMTSLEIASVLGKNHFDVMKAIRKMEPAWEKARESKFALSYRTAEGQGLKKYPYYILTKTECLFVATKFNDEARAKLVLRWEQLERERLMNTQNDLRPTHFNENNANSDSNLPVDPRNMSRKQLLLMALEAEEERERLKAEKEELEAENYGLMIESGEKDLKIQQLTERTAYLNVIMADKSTVTVTQIAQDYGMAAKAFNELLKGLHIQRRVGEQWILYGEHLNKGYVATRMIPIHHSCQPDTYRPLTAWTQAGRMFLYDSLKKHGVLPLIERQQPGEGGAS